MAVHSVFKSFPHCIFVKMIFLKIEDFVDGTIKVQLHTNCSVNSI